MENRAGGRSRQGSTRDMLPWQPGDVVMAADRSLYIRCSEGNDGGGRWPWSQGAGYVPEISDQGVGGGSTADEDVPRPLTLIIRGGLPLGGVVIDDRAIRGALARDELPSAGGRAERGASG